MAGFPYLGKQAQGLTILVLLLAIGLTGCVVPEALIVQPPASSAPLPPPAPLAAPTTINPYLKAALAHSPATTKYFAFTNWMVIKEISGVSDLTSADTMDERLDFILPLTVKEQALASFFANSHFLDHAEVWGWDATDLLWEAHLMSDGPPLFLLRFRDDFDFTPVLDRFEERGYTRTDHAGTPLYHHEMDLTASWLSQTEFAILNVAFLEDEKLFVLSSALESVTDLLDSSAQGATLASQPAVYSVAAALGDAGAAILSPLGCQPFHIESALNVSPEIREALMEELDDGGITGVFDVFGLGYGVETINGESLPLGIFVHHYPIAAQATADLDPRRQVAERANSLAINAPYAELFEVIDAEVTEDNTGGANLILKLHALDRAPQLFINMFHERDLLFSSCAAE